MHYANIYNILIARAINRNTGGYLEKHHIVPKCMGGTNGVNNIVRLTPEEHYLAHQLLVKIYPENRQLIHAAVMMCICTGKNRNRSKNKLFGWLRRKHAAAISISQSGEGNSQTGTCWVYNLSEKISKKISKDSLGNYIGLGWIQGRKLNFAEKCSICNECGIKFSGLRRFCSHTCSYTALGKQSSSNSKLNGREREFLSLMDSGYSMNSAMIQMGLSGSSGSNYTWAKKTIDNIAG